MRGKPATGGAKVGSERNIPAYAGKTKAQCPRIAYLEEHPRVCGENPHGRIGVVFRVGTSPRMRGKLRNQEDLFRKTRNIPAYAGKTICRSVISGSRAEHPRVCGENIAPPGEGRLQGGTSPRMRGKLLDFFSTRQMGRNIPAYAGKTSDRRLRQRAF